MVSMAAEPPLRGSPAVVDAIHRCEAKTPIDMLGLHGIGQPVNTQDTLIKFEPIGNDGVGLRNV